MAKKPAQNKTQTKAGKPAFVFPEGKRMYALIIFCSAFALYFNSIFNDYNLDDELVTNGQALTSQGWKVVLPDFGVFSSSQFSDSSFAAKMKYFVPPVFRSLYYQDKSGYKYEYRPLVQASFAVEHALFASRSEPNGPEKDNPHISHFINVILYSCTCVLLFLVLAQLFNSCNPLFPFAAALLFVAHPVHTEVVASIKNRDEIMALLFALLGFRCALRFAARGKGYYIFLLAIAFWLSLLSKPTSITFAVIIPMALIMFTAISFRGLMLVASVLAVLAVFYSRFYYVWQQLLLFSAILSAAIVAYGAWHFSSIREQIKAIFKALLHNLSSRSIKKESPQADLDFNFLLRPKKFLSIAGGLLLSVALAAFAAYQSWYWLSCLVGLGFAIAYIRSKEKGRIVLITPIALVLLLQVYFYRNHAANLVTPQVALVLFLAPLFFSGPRISRIMALVNYVLFAGICYFVFHTGAVFLLFPLTIAGFYYPKLWFLPLIVLADSLWYEGRIMVQFMHGTRQLTPEMLRWPVLQSGLILCWLGKKQHLQWAAVVAVPLLVLLFISFRPVHKSIDSLAPFKRAAVNFNHAKAIDPTPVQSAVRPLKFAEFPLSHSDSYSRRLGLASEVLIRYLKLVIIPYPLSYYYGYAYITPEEITAPLSLFSLTVYFSIAAAALFFYKRRPILSFALLFYLISISVYTDIIAPIPGIMGDRFLLVPSIGFCLLVSLGLFALFKQNAGDRTGNFSSLTKPFKYAMSGVLLVYSLLIVARNTDWRDHLTLYRHDIPHVENSAQAQNLLGVQLLAKATHEPDNNQKKAMAEEAIGHFKRALEIYPEFVNASFDLGRTYEFLGRTDEAYSQYKRTSDLDTSFTTPLFYMAVILHTKGDYAATIPLYEKYISKNPFQAQAYANLSYAYYKMKDFDKSIDVNKRALAVSPGAFSPLVNIAKTFIAENKPDSALYYFQLAHAVNPQDHDVNLYIERFSKK